VHFSSPLAAARIASGEHWPSDVGGLLFACGWVLIKDAIG
jgi:membrane-associated phospholipid phosphatase